MSSELDKITEQELSAVFLSKITKCTTSNINIFVSSSGNDTLGIGTYINPYKTILKAVSVLPQVINHKINIFIINGTYDEQLSLNGYLGNGSINIYGCISESSVVDISLSTATYFKINLLYIESCSCTVNISGISFINSAVLDNSIYISNSTNINFKYCIMSSTIIKYCLKSINSIVSIDNSILSNCQNAIYSIRSNVYITNSSGTSNTIAYYSDGSYITLDGNTSITGIDLVINGGIINTSNRLLTWINVTYQGVYSGTLKYVKDCFGVVYLKGSIKASRNMIVNETICVLPVKYRCSNNYMINLSPIKNSTAATITICINSDGSIKTHPGILYNKTSAETYLIDTTFKAEI